MTKMTLELREYIDANVESLWEDYVEKIAYDNDCQRHKNNMLNSERCFEEYCEQRLAEEKKI